MPSDLSPPAWAVTRDGRRAPFDGDRVCQALFAATEAVGQPDAFLARELGESVIHFLASEHDSQVTTDQIAECVVKVLRELGQPELARAFEARADTASVERHVYSRDLTAAIGAGLLQLGEGDGTERLAGCVWGPPAGSSDDLSGELRQVGQRTGVVAIDGLDWRGGAAGLPIAGLALFLNLNCATPPPASAPLVAGPLFASPSPPPAPQRGEWAEALVTRLPRELPWARIEWHLAETDFTGPNRERLTRIARRALDGAPIRFVFDRPRRPIALAEGLDRDHRATLLVAGLNLPRLAAQPGMLADAARYCQRLGSLVRLALSAAVQKRTYLRQRLGEAVTSGFLLDRARFVVVPEGLDEVVRQFTGWGLANGGESLELGRAIVRRVVEVLRQDGRAVGMAACVEVNDPVGATASPRSQLRAAGALHAIAERGTLALSVAEETEASEVVDWLEQAWRQGEVHRLRVVRAPVGRPGG